MQPDPRSPPSKSIQRAQQLSPRTARAGDTSPHNLQELLKKLGEAGGEHGQVSVEQMLDTVGSRSFGPLLLLCGVIAFWPISIPGLATVIAALVLLIAVQLLMHRQQFWLPQWLLRRKMRQQHLQKATHFMLPPARFIDRIVHPRLQFFCGPLAARVVAGVCVIVALAMPPLELLPFSNSAMGAVLTLFGLALIAKDGLLVLLGLVSCAVTLGLALKWALA